MLDSTAVTSTPASNPKPRFLIDSIMLAEEIHLLGGPSGSGKTSFAFRFLGMLAEGKDIFGYKSHPVPMCYAACDRSIESIQLTLDRQSKLIIPMFSLVTDETIGFNIESVVKRALELVPDLGLLIIDGIGSLTPGGKNNDYRVVQQFLCKCSRLCRKYHITIIGLGHATKTKEGEDFKHPRHKFLGSVAWGGFSDTMIYIDSTHPEDASDSTRTVIVLPRHTASIVAQYGFNAAGCFVPMDDIDTDLTYDANLWNLALGVEVKTEVIKTWGAGASISTTERWIREAISAGKLEKVRKGVYRRPHPS